MTTSANQEHVVLLTAAEVAALPTAPLGADEAVQNRVLWRREGSSAGVLQIAGGHRLGTHAHRVNHHHFWVLDGHARVLDVEVGPGAYVHVPSGVHHDIDATGTEGCTVFYVYGSSAP